MSNNKPGANPLRSQKEAEPKKRLQFDYDPEQLEVLERMRVALHASSYAEVQRRAVKLLEKVLAMLAEDGEVILREPGKPDRSLILV